MNSFLSGLDNLKPSKHFAKKAAQTKPPPDDLTILAALLNGTAVGAHLFIPIAKGRQARVRVVSVNSGTTVKAQDGAPEPLIIVDNRDETGDGTYSGHSLYVCYGSGEVKLEDATPIEPGDTEAICEQLRQLSPKQFSAEDETARDLDNDVFLDVAERIAEGWNEKLAAGGEVSQGEIEAAAEHLNGGDWEILYDQSGEQFVICELAPHVDKKTGRKGLISATGKVTWQD